MLLNVEFEDTNDILDADFEDNDSFDVNFGNVVYPITRIPIATREQLGGIIVGPNLEVEPDGTLSADPTAMSDEISNMDIERIIGGL